MKTYIEHVKQFVVEKHEELPAAHKAEMRINGIDPDNHWELKWSFDTQEAAFAQCEKDEAWIKKFCEDHGYVNNTKYRVRDLGSSIQIERSIFF